MPLVLSNAFIDAKAGTMGGVPCFKGTRVPVKTLFDYLEAGDTLEEFLDQFPSVSKEQTVQVLKASQQALLAAF